MVDFGASRERMGDQYSFYLSAQRVEKEDTDDYLKSKTLKLPSRREEKKKGGGVKGSRYWKTH